jgi:hypothetical protein
MRIGRRAVLNRKRTAITAESFGGEVKVWIQFPTSDL